MEWIYLVQNRGIDGLLWTVLRLRMEEQPPIWRAVANTLNKQSRTADKGWSFSFGEVLTTHRKKLVLLRIMNTCLGLSYLYIQNAEIFRLRNS